MLNKLWIGFLKFVNPNAFLPISRERAIEIAIEECERLGWGYSKDKNKIYVSRSFDSWKVQPWGPPMAGRPLASIYVDVNDGSIKHTSRVLY